MREHSKPRLHHYFPQFHIAHFALTNSKIWAFDKRERMSPNPKAIPPRTVAAEAHLYDDDAPEESLEGVEEWLAASIDGPAASVFRKVVARQNITESERSDLGRYVMSWDLRTPATRDFILTRAQAEIAADYDRRIADTSALRETIRADSGVDISEEEIRALGRVHRPVVTKGFWLEFLQRHCAQALPRLLTKGWTLMNADADCEFITSDIGILKHRGAWDQLVPYAPGWWNNADAWLLPLTPKLILMMAPGLLDQEKLAQRVFVDQVNRAIAKQANEFVFAASETELRRAIDAS